MEKPRITNQGALSLIQLHERATERGHSVANLSSSMRTEYILYHVLKASSMKQ